MNVSLKMLEKSISYVCIYNRHTCEHVASEIYYIISRYDIWRKWILQQNKVGLNKRIF